MEKGCFRVSPKGTDVMGMVAAQGLPLGRCLGVAESSLSLSLSTPWFLAKKASSGALCGAAHHSLGSTCRVSERGIGRSRLAGRGACSSVTTPSPVAFEEAPSRAPSRAGSRSAERRGPDPGPRRSPSVPVCVERFRLLQNTGGHTQGVPNAWRLTHRVPHPTQSLRAHAHNNRGVAS